MKANFDEKDFLEKLTHNYIDMEYNNPFYEWERRTSPLRYAKHISGGRLLELGCSSGASTLKFSELADVVICVEAVAEFISVTEKRVQEKGILNVEFVNSLFEDIKYDNEFDYIVANYVLEHVENVDSILQVCYKALKPAGLLVSTVPNAQAFSRQLAVKMGLMNNIYDLTENDHKVGHRRTFDKISFEKAITGNKFEIIHRGGDFFKPFADFQLEKMMKASIIGEEQLEGLVKMGDTYPELCHGIFVVAKKP